MFAVLCVLQAKPFHDETNSNGAHFFAFLSFQMADTDWYHPGISYLQITFISWKFYKVYFQLFDGLLAFSWAKSSSASSAVFTRIK